MRTRRSMLTGVAVSIALAGCTINIGDPRGSGEPETDRSQEPIEEPEPTTETETPSTPDKENEPSGRLSVFSMSPLDGWQVTANVEMGDADGILIIYQNDILERVETSGRHRVAGGDDEDDKLMHYEDVEGGDRFALVAGYDDDRKEPIELAEEYAL